MFHAKNLGLFLKSNEETRNYNYLCAVQIIHGSFAAAPEGLLKHGQRTTSRNPKNHTMCATELWDLPAKIKTQGAK